MSSECPFHLIGTIPSFSFVKTLNFSFHLCSQERQQNMEALPFPQLTSPSVLFWFWFCIVRKHLAGGVHISSDSPRSGLQSLNLLQYLEPSFMPSSTNTPSALPLKHSHFQIRLPPSMTSLRPSHLHFHEQRGLLFLKEWMLCPTFLKIISIIVLYPLIWIGSVVWATGRGQILT